MSHFIETLNLKKDYKRDKKVTKALNGVSFNINQGETIALLGANGAGKTTLSSILATLHPPTEGDILFKKESIYKNLSEYRRLIGFCPQRPNLINELTIRQNLEFAGRYFGLDEKTVQKNVTELVEKYQLQNYFDSNPDVLSGGYRQRVLLARSLMHSPQILILDEPTVGLDPNIRRQLWDNIKQLQKNGITIILTTHYLEEAEMLADRICILDKGLVKLIDTKQNIKTLYQNESLENIFVQLLHEEAQ